MSGPYGARIPTDYGPRGVIDEPEVSHAGNLVIRVGNENGANLAQCGWTQVAHVVLDPDEALDLLGALARALAESRDILARRAAREAGSS